MKTKFLKSIFFVALAAGIVASCVNDDDYGIPAVDCVDPSIVANATVEEIFAQATTAATLYNDDDIIEAYVVSSDKGGNFYKTLYLTSLDGTRGFNIQVNDVNLFTQFNVGRKIYIKLKGLYTQIRSNTLQIGALYNGNVGQIGEDVYASHLIRSCTVVEESTLINPISVSQVNDSYLGKLVELTDVQFTDGSLNQTYYNTANVDGGGQTLTYITDASNSATIPFRTSSFAEYAGIQVSQNSGKIRGVLTKFNATYQFVARYTSDIQLDQPRLGPGGGTCVDPETANKTVVEIFNQATTNATQYTANDVIEGYVVSSDQGGNFYKTLYLVNADGSKGFSVQINKTDLYVDYPVGKKVFVKLNGLYTQIRSNTLQIGALFNGNVGQIDGASIGQYIAKGCEQKTEAELTNTLLLSNAISDANIGKLIELDAVQFNDAAVGDKYYDAANVIGGQTNHIITDAQGNTVIFRTSSFAEYADLVVPGNSGKIKGILTKFNSDYQFIARRTSDINLTGARFTVGGGGNPNPGQSATAIGGTNIVYATSLNETFESYATQPTGTVNYTPGQYTTFTNYVNDAVSGPRYWGMAAFSGNKYIQMSAHNTNSNAKTYFIIPVNFTGGRTLQFKTKDGFNNGNVLKVYWSTAYTPNANITQSMLNDITGSFVIASGSTSGYATNYTSSGNPVSIPATGNGFIIFEYNGTHPSGATTTMQLDDIVIN